MKAAPILLPLCLAAAACSPPADAPDAAAPTDAAPAAEAVPDAAPMEPAPSPEAAPAPMDAAAPADDAPKAKITMFNATCPGDIEVHADDGGPVFVNGREAAYKSFSESYYEATDAETGVTVSVSINTDGTLSLSYTGKGGANGICALAE
ncbi:hypothetical protein [Marilutibacter maris]|nr:hypothetical protein [Lysobacter maris]